MTADRETLRKRFLGILKRNSLESKDAATLLHVSVHAVNGWRRVASGNPVPLWAIELLEFKMAARKEGAR